MTLTHSVHYSKQTNTLENYYFQVFHQHDMIIKEEMPPENFLFTLNCDTPLPHSVTRPPP